MFQGVQMICTFIVWSCSAESLIIIQNKDDIRIRKPLEKWGVFHTITNISVGLLAESTSVNPKQCRKLKFNCMYIIIKRFFCCNLEYITSRTFALALRACANTFSLWKISFSLFIPNCTQNHLITYTNGIPVKLKMF